MNNIRCIFVEKKEGFNVDAIGLLNDLKTNLGVEGLDKVRIINKYTIGDISEEYYKKAVTTIFSEATVDNVYEEFKLENNDIAFGVEFLPGQYDMRADSASECIMLLSSNRVEVKWTKIVVLQGELTNQKIQAIKSYYINPVDSREVDINEVKLGASLPTPKDVEILNGFIQKTREDLTVFHNNLGLAMSIDDLEMIRDYFKEEGREPSITEIKVIDTYWSDHCRHTTFQTKITEITIQEGKYADLIENAYLSYMNSRDYVYGEDSDRDVNLMDIAVISMKEMRKRGILDDLDISEEINACSINVKVETENGEEDYLLMFKNETHNHPTEIEPFGGAATCLGGAIRDPLSGRTYVYQAMRVTGAADVTKPVEETIKGKLPQKTISVGAAHGYSSYGNQIGLATGEVAEVYHENYVAKRMEVGAVIAAAPKENVVRMEPTVGDVVILLGGKTGRDGIGGATGSSKEHTEDSINECGAEVQKGNAPTERKIQRLFRNKELTTLIKRCNDFGAGGVSVAIGELCRGIDIDLDMVPKKYEGLDGTELAISESQERMAVVVNENNVDKFIKLCYEENLEGIVVAKVTDTDRLRMFWRGNTIVDIKRTFLDTNGATQETAVFVKSPIEKSPLNKEVKNVKEEWINNIKSLNVASQKGLIERFDSTIGSNTVLMPFGGKYNLTKTEGMVATIPVLRGQSNTASIMTYGFNPDLGVWSPFHMAYYSVIESLTKLAALGGNARKARLTFQEYFERLGKDEERWGKPFSALLGAYKAQMDMEVPSIGGKDSMSGSFGDIDVPPTLISFAVGTQAPDRVISHEFKKESSKIVLLKASRIEDDTLNIEEFKNNLDILYKLIGEGKIISAFSLKMGGVSEALTKMALGNKIGVEIENLSKEELFDLNYGSLVVEFIGSEEELNGANYKLIGRTINEEVIISKEHDLSISLEEGKNALEVTLNKVFKEKTNDVEVKIETKLYNTNKIVAPSIKIAKPRVLIPVFPGNNCEYDCERAFLKAGAEAKVFVLNNLNKESLTESIKDLGNEIKKSQMIMIPGGFSAGDEPDGSAKFIATVFRNKIIKEEVMELLNNRDGLMLGVCNGFQALIKLGLLPYGEIRDIEEDMATLTYNNINRHMSSMIKTKIVSNKSPWLQGVNLGDVHTVAISHGEGRFVAPQELINKLIENGQVATQYVDLDGEVSVNMPFNPNGSMLGIEGITSEDGRILGKMAHSERIGNNLYKNVYGDFDQKIFESGVKYFK
ncbi:MAG: phosphoribosylformylglycinamidine synthase [Clostridium sp.]